jgi:hypothetical protein
VVRLVAALAPCWVLREQPALVGCCLWGQPTTVGLLLPAFCGGGGFWWWLWGWLLVEMCIVDASICRHACLGVLVCVIVVVKLPRADGGCLGTRSR